MLSGCLILFGLWLLNRLLGDLIVNRLQDLYDKIRKGHVSRIDSKTQSVISNINSDLAILRSEMQASRAYIFEFHNGDEFISRFPIWKLSQTYEKVKPGITYEGQNLQNLPATLIWDDYLKTLYTKDVDEYPPGIKPVSENLQCSNGCSYPRLVYQYDIMNMDLNLGPTRSLLERQGIYYMLQTPIINSKGDIVGLVGVDYCDSDGIQTIEEICVCKLCRFASQIALSWETNSGAKMKMLKHQKNLWNTDES